MRTFSLVCLVTLVAATSIAEPVEAGRRGRRRAAVAVGIVAATARRPVAAAATVVARPTYAVLTPDLTITEMATEDNLQWVTVKNIGQSASPATQLQIDFRRYSDGVLIARKRVRVLALQVNQSLRFRLYALPSGHLNVVARVDPNHQVVELSERNNDLSTERAAHSPAVEPAMLEDVDVWMTPDGGARE